MDDQSSTLKIYALFLSIVLWNWISSLRDFKVRQKKGVVRKRNSTRIRLSRLSWLPFSNLAIWENHSYSICKLGKHLPRGLFWGLNENTCQALSPRYIFSYYNSWKYWREEGFPGGSDSKSLPAMQKTQVQSLGWEDPLEKGMATHSSILAWRIPLSEEPGGVQSMGSQRVDWTSKYTNR